ncbi:MAG TPA: diaminopimelate decarboxylase [Rhizomicrobium sp.]|nr:diaminopimelate decarboxylase [Rhizomicrobium sp.]
MSAFRYRDGRLFAEGVALAAIADEAGTPFYCYSASTLEANYAAFAREFPGALIAYSVKANGNLAVLKTLAQKGAGADVVSGGELRRALAAGIAPGRIVFSGIGKTAPEMKLALEAGIHQFNVESEPELEALSAVAASVGMTASIAFRLNPDVDARTHAKITTGKAGSKFGVPFARARELYRKAAALPGIACVGVDVHIGSQVTDLDAFREAFARVLGLVDELRAGGHAISRADLGGGLGVAYRPGETSPSLSAYGTIVNRALAGKNLALILEPGRAIAADAGALVARVLYVKDGESRPFLILDAGMNDLIRPALYDAHHEILSVNESPDEGPNESQGALVRYDVVGPVCESSDVFRADCPLPAMKSGDLVAIMTAGAYGAVMSSAYNARQPAAEVLVKGSRWSVVRPRRNDDDDIRRDLVPSWLSA